MKTKTIVAFGKNKWARRVTGFAVAAAFAFGLAACGGEGNTIVPWEAPDEDAQAVTTLMAGGGYSSFAEFDVDDSIKSVSTGIDCYRKGKLVKSEDEGAFNLDPEDEKAGTHGVIGFVLRDGKLTMGQTADGLTSFVSDEELPGYDRDSEEGLGFAPMSQESQIRPGKKVYLGFIGTGDIANPEAAAEDTELLVSNEQAWVIYAVFSDKPADEDE